MSSKMLNLSTSLQIQLDCHCSCIIICLRKSLSRRRKVIPDIFLLFPMFDLFIISLIQMSLQESFKAIYLCGFMWIQCRRLCGYSVGTQKMLVELIKKKKNLTYESHHLLLTGPKGLKSTMFGAIRGEQSYALNGLERGRKRFNSWAWEDQALNS